MQVNRLEKLLEFYKNDPADEFVQYALATEYLRLNDTDKALYYYNGLINNHPLYVGTYYHLAKLYEKLGRIPEAVKTYEKGIEVAMEIKDRHALSELQSAYLHLTMGDEDDDDF